MGVINMTDFLLWIGVICLGTIIATVTVGICTAIYQGIKEGMKK